MRFEHIPQPLPAELRHYETDARRRLSELHADYLRRAAPILAELEAIEQFRPPPTIFAYPETDAERADFDARGETR